MPLIDTHAHLDVFETEGILTEVLGRAQAAGVSRVVAIGGTPEANARALRLAAAHPGSLRATVGLDRDEIGKPVDESLLRAQAADACAVAIGETGLDYHYGPNTRTAQCELFERMLALAAETRKPVVIHSREADDDTIALLRAHAARPGIDAERLGILHCFTGAEAFARRLLDLGYFISFSGIVTFKNGADLRAISRRVPLDRLLVETDAPYLAPVPHRGKRNEPAWVVPVAEALASERGLPLQAVQDAVWANAARLFQWEPEDIL